jgi:hypothetical protein
MPGRLFVVCVCALLAAAHAVRAAVIPGIEIAVRVYDSAGLEPHVRQAALHEAASALAAAGMDVRWESCQRQQASACAKPLKRDEFAVRIVRRQTDPGHRGALPLGDAFVDAASGTGVLATIYLNRVEWLASAAEGDAATLLGRAIAHELGHLLLATTAHGETGLMRAVWSRDEIRRARRADWAFTDTEIAAMRARRRGVPLQAVGPSVQAAVSHVGASTGLDSGEPR